MIYTTTIFLVGGQHNFFDPQLVNNLSVVRCFNINNEYLKMSRKQQIPNRSI